MHKVLTMVCSSCMCCAGTLRAPVDLLEVALRHRRAIGVRRASGGVVGVAEATAVVRGGQALVEVLLEHVPICTGEGGKPRTSDSFFVLRTSLLLTRVASRAQSSARRGFEGRSGVRE